MSDERAKALAAATAELIQTELAPLRQKIDQLEKNRRGLTEETMEILGAGLFDAVSKWMERNTKPLIDRITQLEDQVVLRRSKEGR